MPIALLASARCIGVLVCMPVSMAEGKWACVPVQEFMRAFQCFMYEFWDLEVRELSDLLTDKEVKSKLMGGWCVIMPENTRICHVRR